MTTTTVDTRSLLPGIEVPVRNLTDDHIDALLDRLECAYYYEISELVEYVNRSQSLNIPIPDKWMETDEDQFYDMVIQCVDCNIYQHDVGSEVSDDGSLCIDCFMKRATGD